jgi:hypothetical protein
MRSDCVLCCSLTVLHHVRHGVSSDGVDEDAVHHGPEAVGGDVAAVVGVEPASGSARQRTTGQTVQHATAEERRRRHRAQGDTQEATADLHNSEDNSSNTERRQRALCVRGGGGAVREVQQVQRRCCTTTDTTED